MQRSKINIDLANQPAADPNQEPAQETQGFAEESFYSFKNEPEPNENSQRKEDLLKSSNVKPNNKVIMT